MGPEKHRKIRWRPEKSDHLWSERRRRFRGLSRLIRPFNRYTSQPSFPPNFKLFKRKINSSGLFSQAISMSGSPLNLYWGLQPSEEAEAEAFALGSKLGVRIKNKDVLLSALYSASANNIVTKASELPPVKLIHSLFELRHHW